MHLKTRIVVMKPEHHNEIFILKKNQLEGKKFTHKDRAYLINDDNFQLTTGRKWWTAWLVKEYYATYYYAEGNVNPLPVPTFKELITKSGVESEELAALFNPWFYRTIAAPTRNAWEQIQFYMNIATLLGVAFLIYKLVMAPHDPASATDAAANPPVTGGGPVNG
jgi:hypothetical protein